MWNQGPPPPIHQQPPQHFANLPATANTSQTVSLHLPAQVSADDPASQRAKDLQHWSQAFEKHELVEILVNISKSNRQFQSFLGHAFVTDIKWCKIRVTFTPSQSQPSSPASPDSAQIQQHFTRFGNMRHIECFPSIHSALITFANYTSAQAAVSEGVHDNVEGTGYNASCCYEFEGSSEQPPTNADILQQHVQPQQSQGQMQPQQTQQQGLFPPASGNVQLHAMHAAATVIGGPLDQRRLFVSSLSYSTTDETLRNVFTQYGELEDCTIVRDKLTHRSKGYGFVVFKHVGGAINALKQPEKFIDHRRTRSWLAAQGNQFKTHR